MGLNRGKIDESRVTQMLGWNHSGFGVHHAVRLDADDLAGRERLAQYMLRCPFSLERMIRVTKEGKVIYLAEKKACRRFPKPTSPRAPRRTHRRRRSTNSSTSMTSSSSTTPDRPRPSTSMTMPHWGVMDSRGTLLTSSSKMQ